MAPVVRPLVASLVFAVLALCSTPAHAGRGFVLITSGDSISHVADLMPELAAEADKELGPGVAVGYKYEQFGLFFIEFWTWGGQYVLFRDDEYWTPGDATVAAAAGVASVEDLGKPILYRAPLGLLVLGGLVVGYVLYRLVAGRSAPDPEQPTMASFELAHDPRYLGALQLYEQNPQMPPDERFARAAFHLIQQGIAEPEANANLWRLLQARGLAPHAPQ
jgi:hypothetical protein